jgi:hypothetical protein
MPARRSPAARAGTARRSAPGKEERCRGRATSTWFQATTVGGSMWRGRTSEGHAPDTAGGMATGEADCAAKPVGGAASRTRRPDPRAQHVRPRSATNQRLRRSSRPARAWPQRPLALAAHRRDDRAVAAELVCCECESDSAGCATGWRAYLVDLDEDGEDKVVFFCPDCAAREFGPRAASGAQSADGG